MGFDCGVPALNRYLIEQAGQDMRRRVSNCFLAVSETGAVAGFYTFAAGSLPLVDLPRDVTRRLPRYGDVPAALIGRLAVDLRYTGRGLGTGLIADAVERAVVSAPAVFLLFVDAKDAAAVPFYLRHGFRTLSNNSLRLFLPVATAEKTLLKR
jgi:GNAT superfamily N-acetyltransferase